MRLRHLSGAIVAALAFSAGAQATDFSQVIVFGDSLSDSGNISLATAPGIQPPLKFTTNPGTVTIENVASAYGTTLAPSLLPGGSNFAWGGAGVMTNSPGTPSSVPTVTAQITGYLAAGAADPNALYSVWGGANDIFYHATAVGASGVAAQLIAANTAGLPPDVAAQVAAGIRAQVAAGAGVAALETPEQAQMAVGGAAQQEVQLLGQLQAAGARNILVFNLPNIGTTPSAAAQGAEAASSLTQLALLYNGQLNAGLAQLDVGIIPVDTYSLLGEVVANPEAFGFSNVTDPACGAGASSVMCGPAGSGLPYTYADGSNESHLFADGVHPTNGAHRMLSQYVMAELAAPGQVSLLAEAPMAAYDAHSRVLGQQMLADTLGAQTRVFSSVDYARQQFDATSGSPEVESNNVNLTAGVDASVNDHVSAGVALGMARNHAHVQGDAGGYRLQTMTGSGYALYHRGGGYVGAYGSFSQLDYNDIARSFDLGALRRIESGKTQGSQLAAGLAGGWWFGGDSLRTGPFAGLEWQRIRVSGYSEAGSDSSAMWFGRQERKALVGTLGWRLTGNWQAGGSLLHPYVELAWNRDSQADDARVVEAGLVGMNGTFALSGYTPDEDWGSASVGLRAEFSDKVSGWLGYNGRFGADTQTFNSANVGLSIAL